MSLLLDNKNDLGLGAIRSSNNLSILTTKGEMAPDRAPIVSVRLCLESK